MIYSTTQTTEFILFLSSGLLWSSYTSPTPSIPLPLSPHCDCLASALFQHPPQHSLRLQGLASWCKVNHTGGREDGERERERARSTYHPLGHMVETQHGWEKRKCVNNISTSPSAHSHVTPAYASTAQTISDMKTKLAPLLLSLACDSQNKSAVNESKTLLKSALHFQLKCKLCIKPASDLRGGL